MRMRHLFLTDRFFAVFGGLIALFALAYPFPGLFPLAFVALAIATALTVLDCGILFLKKPGIGALRRTSAV